ncbi:hypothetical protein [Planctomicrobium piriforme]|uniref:Uncharacterized protein n=1 Tax=Planctomicrobium piriforme TaxID=1576369 RepID=A0A1I3QUA9_9PLAN|nr:hypothetical protein [Planctomicrobium piriforme]SFJ37843.1 hypothetical protein SAMN05421753_11957 [Planctomicrobium piriforme]
MSERKSIVSRRVAVALIAMLLLACLYTVYFYLPVMSSEPPLFCESIGTDDSTGRAEWISHDRVYDRHENTLQVDVSRNIIFVMAQGASGAIGVNVQPGAKPSVEWGITWMDSHEPKIIGRTSILFTQNQLVMATADGTYETAIKPGQAKGLLKKMKRDRAIEVECLLPLVTPFVPARELEAFQNVSSELCHSN